MSKLNLMSSGSAKIPVQTVSLSSVKAQAAAQELQKAALDRIIQKQHEFEQWRRQETERIETKKQNLYRQTKQIEAEQLQLNIEKSHFLRQRKFEEEKRKREERLIEAQRRILQEELYKLAEERKTFEQRKILYDQRNSRQERKQEQERIRIKPQEAAQMLFFAGVDSRSSLKKRYKELLKIFHPDNKCGDNGAILEINREYQCLLEKF